MSKRLAALLAGVMAVAIIVAGCGSGSDDSTETTVVLTKAEFIEQGDAICAKGTAQLEDEADEYAKDNDVDMSNPTKKDQEEVIATVVAPALQAQADELKELGSPDGEEDATAEIVEALEDAVAELEDNPSSLLKSQGEGPLDKAAGLASEFGFKECGQ